MGFLKNVFATVTGIIVFIILAVILVVILLPKEEELAENSILSIDLNKTIVEREEGSLLDAVQPAFSGSEGVIGLLELKKTIEKAKNDSKIKGIILNLQNMEAGFATLEEVRKSLSDFKKSGKFLYAYSESYSEGNYYLASIADKIYLPESGMLELNGLVVEILFFKGTLEKLNIEPEIFPVGKYKSAVEPFRFEKMSDENRIQVKSFLNSIYSHYLNSVGNSRNIKPSALRNLSDSMLVRTSKEALQYKLVSNIGYYDELLDEVRNRLKIPQDEKVNIISLEDYEEKSIELPAKDGGSKIAVIYATGEIIQGEGNKNTIGSESLSEQIRKARLDENIKAVVLRINSPGGSALASDIIWREIVKTRETKPVIASMSDVAASGGYYIAAPCDTIVAHPNTVTGSIGVFGILFNGKEFLNEKLGITTDRVKTGEFADIGSFTRDMSEYERKIIRKEVQRIYDDFKQKVAMGRNMDTSEVEQYAQGRVWSGIEAKEKGLVDVLGGLEEAVKIAAAKAKLGEDYDVVYLPEIKPFILKELLKGMDESSISQAQKPIELEKYRPYLEALLTIERMEGIQTRMPFELIIR